MTRPIAGIDLGTTHSVLVTSAAPAADNGALQLEPEPILQLEDRNALEKLKQLPSFLYLPDASEPALPLPWASERPYAVGSYARRRASEVPGRVISSAKSWLCHARVDRRSALLPQHAAEGLTKLSPVTVSARFLEHLGEAVQHEHTHAPALNEHDVVLTVPASFDAEARQLTLEAANLAGLNRVTLLEEPLAALYAWIQSQGDSWRNGLVVGDLICVVDIGGGTSDFSAVEVREQQGELLLHRVAVGEHILLGGDNMDLALAHFVAERLREQGQTIEPAQRDALTHACRAAKEQLLSAEARASVPVVLATRGAKLFGSTLRYELTREDVLRIIVDGFFPEVDVHAELQRRPRAGLAQQGLPYASDPAITRHLLSFLRRNRASAEHVPKVAPGSGAVAAEPALMRTTKVLFNGGVLKAPVIRERLLNSLNRWLAQNAYAPVAALAGEDLDHAVARGAAYYGLVQRGTGLRIRGGAARSYYLGVESPAPAVPGVEPPVTLLCVAPFGMEEGSRLTLDTLELDLIVGEAARFRFFASTVRHSDTVGCQLEHWSETEISELSPITVQLPTHGRAAGDAVPVRIEVELALSGTLIIEAVPTSETVNHERWRLEFAVSS